MSISNLKSTEYSQTSDMKSKIVILCTAFNNSSLIDLRITINTHNHEISFVPMRLQNWMGKNWYCIRFDTWYAHFQLSAFVICIDFCLNTCGKEIACHIGIAIKIRLYNSVCLLADLFLIPFTCLLILHPCHALWSFSLRAVQILCGFDDNAAINHSPFRDHATFFPAEQYWVLGFCAVRIHIVKVLWQSKLFEMWISGWVNRSKRHAGPLWKMILFVDGI